MEYMVNDEVMNNLLSYLGASGLVILDRRGFIVAESRRAGEGRIKTLLSLFGNYFLTIDSLMNEFKLSDISHILVEAGGSIILAFKVESEEEPLYVAVYYENNTVPLGAILLKIDQVKVVIKDIIKSSILILRSNSMSEADLNKLLDEISEHPLYKALTNKRGDK